MTPDDREPAGARSRSSADVISLLLGGCGEMLTKWECQTGVCRPATQALNKCVAQADATPFASDSLKAAIWEQCMHDEGFKEVPCAAAERTGPDCHFRFFH
jgi:hypothetical protein